MNVHAPGEDYLETAPILQKRTDMARSIEMPSTCTYPDAASVMQSLSCGMADSLLWMKISISI